MLLSFYLTFSQFQSDVAHKSVANKKIVHSGFWMMKYIAELWRWKSPLITSITFAKLYI